MTPPCVQDVWQEEGESTIIIEPVDIHGFPQGRLVTEQGPLGRRTNSPPLLPNLGTPSRLLPSLARLPLAPGSRRWRVGGVEHLRSGVELMWRPESTDMAMEATDVAMEEGETSTSVPSDAKEGVEVLLLIPHSSPLSGVELREVEWSGLE